MGTQRLYAKVDNAFITETHEVKIMGTQRLYAKVRNAFITETHQVKIMGITTHS